MMKSSTNTGASPEYTDIKNAQQLIKLQFVYQKRSDITDNAALVKVLLLSPECHRAEIGKRFKHCILNADHLYNVLELLDMNERLRFALHRRVVLHHEDDVNKVKTLLPINQENITAIASEVIIQNSYDLSKVLALLPEKHCLDVALLLYTAIEEGESKEEAEVHHEVRGMAFLLPLLYESNRARVVAASLDKIKDVKELVDVLDVLPQENRVDIALLCIDMIFKVEELEKVISRLPKQGVEKYICAYDVAEANRAKGVGEITEPKISLRLQQQYADAQQENNKRVLHQLLQSDAGKYDLYKAYRYSMVFTNVVIESVAIYLDQNINALSRAGLFPFRDKDYQQVVEIRVAYNSCQTYAEKLACLRPLLYTFPSIQNRIVSHFQALSGNSTSIALNRLQEIEQRLMEALPRVRTKRTYQMGNTE